MLQVVSQTVAYTVIYYYIQLYIYAEIQLLVLEQTKPFPQQQCFYYRKFLNTCGTAGISDSRVEPGQW